MKKLGDLMKEIGFNPKGSDAVKEAFVKNLIKQAYGTHVQTPSEKKIISENPGKFVSLRSSEKYSDPLQMTFDFDENLNKTLKKTAV